MLNVIDTNTPVVMTVTVEQPGDISDFLKNPKPHKGEHKDPPHGPENGNAKSKKKKRKAKKIL